MSRVFKLFLAEQCPYCHRAEIAALERGLKYEKVLVALGDAMPDWYKKINPNETVPTLQVNNDKLIFESALVAQFFDNCGTPASTLMGRNNYERHRIEFFSSQIGDFISACYGLLKDPQNIEKHKSLHDNAAYINGIVASNQKTGGPFFFDDQFTMAEAMLVPFLIRFSTVLSYYSGCDIFEKAPLLKRMWAAGLERPSLKQSTLSPSEYIKFYEHFVPEGIEARKANFGPVLYGYKFCPFVDRARLACAAKKYKPHYVEVDIKNTPEWYKKFNERETVPTLVTENGEVVHESQLIVNYVDSISKEGRQLIPKGTPESEYDVAIFTTNVGYLVGGMYPFLRDPANREDLVWAAGELSKLLEKKVFGEGPFFGGASMNAGDIALLPFLVRIKASTPELTEGFDFFKEFPLLDKLVTAGMKTPEAEGIFANREKYQESVKGYRVPKK